MTEPRELLNPLAHTMLLALVAAGVSTAVLLVVCFPRVTAIVRREVASFFTSAVAYVTLLFYALMVGNAVMTSLPLMAYTDEPSMQRVFLGFLSATLLVAPVLTMRLIAEERARGTLEQLLCTAVHPAEVVLGKYLAAMCLYCTLVTVTVVYYVAVVRCLGADIDHGEALAGYVGMLLFGSGLMAIGLMVSAFCRSSMSAVVITLALFFGLLFLGTGIERVRGFVERLFAVILPGDGGELPARAGGWVREGLEFISLNVHITSFLEGRLALRDVAYFVSVTVFCLVVVLLAINVRRR
jgi:ABC-2 type transport system permease protein